eukprot:6212198-Pleurochrysis_carterae.AAC.2
MSGPLVFATVGTTQFNALIDAVLAESVLKLLYEQGYRRLRIQVGRGSEPTLPTSAALDIDWYRFKDTLKDDMQDASLIVSHAGAGSIMEGLRCDASLLVVVNDALMDNHQTELADELDRRGHLVAVTPNSLLEGLCRVRDCKASLIPFPESDPQLFPRFLNTAFTFTS